MNNKLVADAADTQGPPANRKQTMKTLTKLALAAVMLTSACAAQADWVSGHFRRNGTYVAPYYRTPANGIPYDNLSYRGYPSQQPGYISPRAWTFDSNLTHLQTMPSYDNSTDTYVYRNPYAAYPSVSVHSYFRNDGTFVPPHDRTPPNDTVTDNLSYRGFGTVRVPKYSSGW